MQQMVPDMSHLAGRVGVGRCKPGTLSDAQSKLLGLPPKELTLCMTDVSGSTALWEWNPRVMDTALALQEGCLRSLLPKHSGHEVSGADLHFWQAAAAVASIVTATGCLHAPWLAHPHLHLDAVQLQSCLVLVVRMTAPSGAQHMQESCGTGSPVRSQAEPPACLQVYTEGDAFVLR